MAASLMLYAGDLVHRHKLPSNPHACTPVLNLPICTWLRLDPARDGYSARRTRPALLGKLPEELARVHGVRAVSLADSVPFASLMVDDQPYARVSTAAH